MDAQALLTPDAVERDMGGRSSRSRIQSATATLSYARHLAGIFIDTFSGLGIHPEPTTG